MSRKPGPPRPGGWREIKGGKTDAAPEKVLFLAYSAPDTTSTEPVRVVLACAACGNKTYTVEAREDCGGRLQCACCGGHIGYIGWLDPDELSGG